MESGVEPPHSIIRRDLWAKMGVRREGDGVPDGAELLTLKCSVSITRARIKINAA